MSEELFRERVKEMIAKADAEQVRKIYFFLLGMLGGTVYERN